MNVRLGVRGIIQSPILGAAVALQKAENSGKAICNELFIVKNINSCKSNFHLTRLNILLILP